MRPTASPGSNCPVTNTRPVAHHTVVVDRVADDDEFQIEITPVRVTSAGE